MAREPASPALFSRLPLWFSRRSVPRLGRCYYLSCRDFFRHRRVCFGVNARKAPALFVLIYAFTGPAKTQSHRVLIPIILL